MLLALTKKLSNFIDISLSSAPYIVFRNNRTNYRSAAVPANSWLIRLCICNSNSAYRCGYFAKKSPIPTLSFQGSDKCIMAQERIKCQNRLWSRLSITGIYPLSLSLSLSLSSFILIDHKISFRIKTVLPNRIKWQKKKA